jgi:hypothetical protein
MHSSVNVKGSAARFRRGKQNFAPTLTALVASALAATTSLIYQGVVVVEKQRAGE